MMAARIAFLLFLLLPLPVLAELRVVEGPPKGFEELATPRLSQVRLFYGGQSLGSFRAHVTPVSLAFDLPQQITTAIPDVTDIPRIEKILGNAMAFHAELLCTEKRKSNCGSLKPDIAGIIFDEKRLEAELFINPRYLSVQDAAKTRYLPLPERSFSSIYGFSGALSGTDATSPTYALTHNAIFSFGEARLLTQSTLANQGVRFDTAQAGIERNGWNAGLGLFRSHGLNLISDRDIAGIGFSTSDSTRIDSYKTEGNTLVMYLPRRSFVSIYREGRLYSSRVYEAGNQIIDTNELPEGAYNITLRIQESDGGTREEQRFFAKSPDLPPPDAPVYYAEAGFLRATAADDKALPEVTRDFFFGAGTVRRIDDNLGLRFAVLGINTRAAFESSAFWLYDATRVKTTLLATTKGDVGVQLGWSYVQDRWSAAFDASKIWAGPAMNPSQLAHSYTQAVALAGYAATDTLNLGLRANYSAVASLQTNASFGPYADWRMWQEGESELGVSLAAARSNGAYEGALLLRFSKRFGAGGITSDVGNSFGHGGRGPAGSVRYWHDASSETEKLLLGAGVTGDSENQSLNGDVDWRNAFGLIHGNVQKSFAGNGTLSYGGNVAFNAAQLDDSLHIGGDQNERSAVLINVSGAEGVAFYIVVDGSKMGMVEGGTSQAVYLAPFRSYKIRLAPVKNGFLDFDKGEQRVTLYPGNVARLEWKAFERVVLAARFVKADGAPLQKAVLQDSAAQLATDEDGRLQAELAKDSPLRFTLPGSGICTAAWPKVAPKNGVILASEPLVCR